MTFEVLARDGAARRGRIVFGRGTVQTPAFMPVGTAGTVKSVTPEEVAEQGASILLGNTFHLMLRPGMDVIRAHGGLHRFMNWPGPILTDSGGFQVWSLTDLRTISEDGVTFRSPLDGSKLFLKKLEEGYDPTDKIGALKRLHESARRGEFATGLVYIEPDRDDFLTQLNLVDEPLATLPLERVRPGREALEEIMEGLR